VTLLLLLRSSGGAGDATAFPAAIALTAVNAIAKNKAAIRNIR